MNSEERACALCVYFPHIFFALLFSRGEGVVIRYRVHTWDER